MGSSETGGVVDCSVGSIVWVRRRNGSWWPGKILGPEELSSSLITSPRSGTPVKLLGREDASVDWYNLEKSKRVKAFRSVEFNDCIERAEAAHGMPPKKREKYARREDAILHAIELERQLVEKKYGKSGNSSIGLRKSPVAVTSSECMENGGNQKDPISDQLTEKLGSSVEEKNGTDQHPCEVTVKEENKPNGDDDSSGALPRMRGLQEFGLQITPMREENPGVAPRAKRSRNSYLAYHSEDCSNDNLTLTTQIEIPVSKLEDSTYQAEMGEDHNSGSMEDTETDCSETDSMESDSDEEMADLSDGSASIELHPKYPRSIETQEEHGSISSSDDFDDMAYADGLSHSSPHGYVSNSTDVSKWQLKGKRNNRNVGKRYPDRSDAEVSKGYINNVNPNSGFKADLTGLCSSNEAADMDTFAWNNQSVMRGHWEDSQEYGDLFFSGRHLIGGRAMLIDVYLKVQANNYRRDVPMISLMSKLNGHAIVGHPIQIEALESGVFENHVYFHPEPLAVWRTGRRTANSRVPRPFLNGENNRRFSRNSANKGSGLSSQKVRTLSSFASDKQHESDPRNGASGLIKTGNLPTIVACVPVNLVFSRLNEELVGRHQ